MSRLQLELERQSEQGDVSNYQANGEFDLIDFSARRNVEYYSCCPEPYPDITYEIRLRRRPMFYVFNLILPCILINGVGESSKICSFPMNSYLSLIRVQINPLIRNTVHKMETRIFLNCISSSFGILQFLLIPTFSHLFSF